MYIGVISDTHGTWDKAFEEFLAPVDEIWHAGDWGGDEQFYKRLEAFKPVKGVIGNIDGYPARNHFPKYQDFDADGMRVLMMHIGGYPGRYNPEARRLIELVRPQIFVCGHSHILKVIYDHQYQMLCINPGACGLEGWQMERTALRFKIENQEIKDMEVFRYQ